MNWCVGPALYYVTAEGLTMDSIRRPSDLVINLEENTFPVPGLSVWPMQNGAMVARARFDNTFADSGATFHNRASGNKARVSGADKANGATDRMASGVGNANFADGHVAFFDPWPSFRSNQPGPNNGLRITATTMWCTDSIPVQ